MKVQQLLFFCAMPVMAIAQIQHQSGWKPDTVWEARVQRFIGERTARSLPAAYSRKQDCPPVTDQKSEKDQTCVGHSIATAYSLLHQARSQEKIQFSPLFVYANADEASQSCNQPIKFSVLDKLKVIGLAPSSLVRPVYCINKQAISETTYQIARTYLLSHYAAIWTTQDTHKTLKMNYLDYIKQGLVNGASMVAGGAFTQDFFKIKPESNFHWKCPSNYDALIQQKDSSIARHAICVIGYDDHFFGTDGGFEIVNSYGAQWGNQGYCWIPYESFVRAIKMVYQLSSKTEFPADWAGIPQLRKFGQAPLPLKLQTSDYRMIHLNLETPLYSGDKFQLMVQGGLIDQYWCALGVNSKQNISILYPNQTHSTLLQAGQSIILPEPLVEFELDNVTGTEHLAIVYSQSRFALAGLKESIETQNQDDFQACMKRVVKGSGNEFKVILIRFNHK